MLADSYFGGILVVWRKSIGQVSPLAISRRALHIIVSPGSATNWIIFVIYNLTCFHSQCSLWHELSKISSINIPWLIISDFNTITTRDEHKGGTFSYYASKAHYFLSFIEDNNLLDLYFSGPRFTWCNNQAGTSRRWACLDRCFVNLDWSSKCNSYSLKHLLRIFSDHAPFLLSFSFNKSHSSNLFCFNNYWLYYIGCHNAVRKA